MKNIGRREAESDILHTCSESNIFRFHPKENIQYLHYYVSDSDMNKCMKSKHFCLPNDSKFLFQVQYCPNNFSNSTVQHIEQSQTTLGTMKSEGNHQTC